MIVTDVHSGLRFLSIVAVAEHGEMASRVSHDFVRFQLSVSSSLLPKVTRAGLSIVTALRLLSTGPQDDAPMRCS